VNRRDFLKVALGLLGATAIPHLPDSASVVAGEMSGGFFSLDAARNAINAIKDNGVIADGGSYVLFVHPDTYYEYLESLSPKEAWKFAYRQARMKIRGMANELLGSGEIGSVEGVRFIVTRNVGRAA
jgi:hypothetical protein